jgi:hypothetical protein
LPKVRDDIRNVERAQLDRSSRQRNLGAHGRPGRSTVFRGPAGHYQALTRPELTIDIRDHAAPNAIRKLIESIQDRHDEPRLH